MSRTIVGLLRGGTSGEYTLSIKTGAAVMKALPEHSFDVRDILIDRRGFWYSRGVAVDPARALAPVDMVINALHGGVGEDGTVQRILAKLSIPYAGSQPLPSALSLNKIRAKAIFHTAGLLVPRSVSFKLTPDISTGEMAQVVFDRFGPPYVVKPPNDGASRGIRYAASIIELPSALADVLDTYGSALVEEYVIGDEAHVGIVEGFRGEELYALPPSQIATKGRILEHAAHEAGTIQHFTPSKFSIPMKQSLIDAARTAHRALGLSHFSRADFIVTPRGPYLLEVNAIPGLYPGAAFPPMLESIGSSTEEFLRHAIALTRK